MSNVVMEAQKRSRHTLEKLTAPTRENPVKESCPTISSQTQLTFIGEVIFL